MGSEFELIEMLDKGIGVHNAGLPDDVKTLMEWLAEEGCLKVLCATTTIAQGINFPVSSVVLQSISMPSKGYSKDMTPREFWNLVGRAGRIGQNSVGLVGLACEPADKEKLTRFVSEKTGALVSRLVELINEIEESGELYNLERHIYKEEWTDFRCYIAHLCNEREKLDDILSDMEQLLRNTLGYNAIKASQNGSIKSKQLLDATKKYASRLLENPQISRFADETGFSPEGVISAYKAIRNLDKTLTPDSLKASSVFGGTNILSDMYGIMLKIPQLKQLQEIPGNGDEHKNIANITTDWVSGSSIYEIAKKYFSGEGTTKSLMIASKAINKQIANAGTWGLSAITKLSGINFEQLTEEQKKEIDALPAMIYHGVRTPEAVLMCINSVPRSISENMGREYKKIASEYSVQEAKKFICSLSENDWEKIKKPGSHMSGKDYMNVWKLFSGL
jgi:replicative superfamily II helicase